MAQCNLCIGTGLQQESNLRTCTSCGGSGRTYDNSNPCMSCGGNGSRYVTESHMCSSCAGTGMIPDYYSAGSSHSSSSIRIGSGDVSNDPIANGTTRRPKTLKESFSGWVFLGLWVAIAYCGIVYSSLKWYWPVGLGFVIGSLVYKLLEVKLDLQDPEDKAKEVEYDKSLASLISLAIWGVISYYGITLTSLHWYWSVGAGLLAYIIIYKLLTDRFARQLRIISYVFSLLMVCSVIFGIYLTTN